MPRTKLERAMRDKRGTEYFPHQYSFVLDNPIRRLLLNPARFADRLKLEESERVLEVGAGSGVFSVAVARRLAHGHLTLLDLQPEMLDKARRKIDRAGLRNVSFEVADVSSRLPFPDGCFDVAFLVAVLGEVSDKPACARTLHRALRPGGRLVVHEHVPDPDRLSLAELREVLEPAGFRLAGTAGSSLSRTAGFHRS